MEDIVKRHREMVSSRIQQSFALQNGDQSLLKADEYNDLEKARVVRQDGDIHPNGKWVWVSSAAGGKGDWRVIKKQKDGAAAPAPSKTEKKETKSDNGAASKSSDALAKTLDDMSAEELTELQSIIASAIQSKGSDVTKESSEKMQGAFKSVIAQGVSQKSKKISDEAKKQDDKEFKAEVKRIVDESSIMNDAAKARARKMFRSVRERFGDRVSAELTSGYQKEPMAVVDFGDGLELQIIYGATDEVKTNWELSGHEGWTESGINGRQFDVYSSVHSPNSYLNYEMKIFEEDLKRLKAKSHYDEDDAYYLEYQLDRMKAIKDRMSRVF